MNKIHWDLNNDRDKCIAMENVVCKMAIPLFWSQCATTVYIVAAAQTGFSVESKCSPMVHFGFYRPMDLQRQDTYLLAMCDVTLFP